MAAATALLVGGAIVSAVATGSKGVQAGKQKKQAQQQFKESVIQGGVAAYKGQQAQEERERVFGEREDAYGEYLNMVEQRREDFGNQLAQYEQLSMQGLPEESKRLMIDQANQGAANAVQGAESARGALGGVARAQSSANDAYRQLSSMDAQQRLQNKQLYAGAMGDYAQNMGMLDQQQLLAQNQLSDYDTQANVDPLVQQQMMALGKSQQATDYQRSLEGSAMQNNAQMWNQFGELGGQFMQMGIQGDGMGGGGTGGTGGTGG